MPPGCGLRPYPGYATARNNPRKPSPGGRGTSRSPDKRSASGIPRPQATEHAAESPPDAACGLIRATRVRLAGTTPPQETARALFAAATPELARSPRSPPPVAPTSEAHPGSHARMPPSTPRDAPRMRPAALSGLRDYRGTILASPLPEGEDIT